MRKLNLTMLGFAVVLGCISRVNRPISDKWKLAETILNEINVPEFPDITYNIVDFGAVADGITLNTEAINNAVKQAHEKGGGIVLVPDGTFLTGAIHLLSNVKLHLSDDAALNFTTNPEEYLPVVLTRWEGVDCYNYSPLIYAYKQENIGISGKGKLNGQASMQNWLKWKEHSVTRTDAARGDPGGRNILMKYNDNQVPVEQRIFGEGYYLRPQFIQFNSCKNIIVQDITIENSPFWVIHPLLSENITLRRVHINSTGSNNDGCDPESSKNVLIEDCYFNTGDDCIALKSGRNSDGRKWNMPVENVIIRNCRMENGHGGIVIGSEISGGCKNIFAENCEMSSPELDRAIRIKTNSQRGGIIENIYVRNIKVGQVKEAVIKINCRYDLSEKDGNYIPLVKDVYISKVQSKKSKYAIYMMGLKGETSIDNINISDCDFEGVEKNYMLQDTGKVVLKNIKINGMETGNE